MASVHEDLIADSLLRNPDYLQILAEAWHKYERLSRLVACRRLGGGSSGGGRGVLLLEQKAFPATANRRVVAAQSLRVLSAETWTLLHVPVSALPFSRSSAFAQF